LRDTAPVRLACCLLDRLSWLAIVGLSFAGAIVVGAFVYLCMPINFTSQASILFNDQPDVIASLQLLAPSNGGSDVRSAASALGMLGGGGASMSQRLEELVHSRRLRRDIVERFRLAERYHGNTKAAEEALKDAIDTRPLGKGSLLIMGASVGMVVSATCQAGPRLAIMLRRPVPYRPEEARKISADLANEVVNFLDRFTTESSIQQARKARDFVEKRTKTAEADLARTESRLLALQRQYRILTPEAKVEELSDEVKTLTELEAQARVQASNSAESLRVLRRQLPREATTRIEQTVTARNPLILQIETELIGLQARLQDETAGGKLETHPDIVTLRQAVQAKQAQLRSVTREVQETVTRGMNPVHEELAVQMVGQVVQLAGAEAGAQLAATRVAQAEARMSNLPPVARDYIHLERQAQLQGDLLGALQKRLEIARLEEQRENSGKFQVLDAAEPPLRKTGPSTSKAALVAFVGLLFVLGLGRAMRLGWIALAEAEAPADE